MEPIFRGEVKAGRIVLESPGEFRAVIAKFEGSAIALRIHKFRNKRTLSQNAYYWAVIIPLLGESCGYDDEEMHDALKHRFLRDRENEKAGLVLVKSSAELNTKAFGEYVDSCIRLAAELGVVIPSPGEYA